MVAGRGRVLLLLQQLVERLLLRIRQTEVQRYAVQHLLGVGPALVVARLRQRMLRAGQRHRRAGPERAGNAAWRGALARLRRGAGETGERQERRRQAPTMLRRIHAMFSQVALRQAAPAATCAA